MLKCESNSNACLKHILIMNIPTYLIEKSQNVNRKPLTTTINYYDKIIHVILVIPNRMLLCFMSTFQPTNSRHFIVNWMKQNIWAARTETEKMCKRFLTYCLQTTSTHILYIHKRAILFLNLFGFRIFFYNLLPLAKDFYGFESLFQSIFLLNCIVRHTHIYNYTKVPYFEIGIVCSL